MQLVIDASVAVKWFVVEDRHELARDVLRDSFTLRAPDLILVETANALRNKVRAGLIAGAQAKLALGEAPNYFDDLIPAKSVLTEAFDIACQMNHPVADCVYLACALATGDPLLTDDSKLIAKARGITGLKIMALGDVKIG